MIQGALEARQWLWLLTDETLEPVWGTLNTAVKQGLDRVFKGSESSQEQHWLDCSWGILPLLERVWQEIMKYITLFQFKIRVCSESLLITSAWGCRRDQKGNKHVSNPREDGGCHGLGLKCPPNLMCVEGNWIMAGGLSQAHSKTYCELTCSAWWVRITFAKTGNHYPGQDMFCGGEPGVFGWGEEIWRPQWTEGPQKSLPLDKNCTFSMWLQRSQF